MQLPIVVLSAAVVLFGVLPGIPLKAVAAIQVSLGLEAVRVGWFSVPREVGELNMVSILAVVVGACSVPYVIMRLCRSSMTVPQWDNYAAGSEVPADRYQYSARFYEPVYEVIEPYVRDRVDAFYYWLVSKSEGAFERIRRMYTGHLNTYVLYVVVFLAIVLVAGWGWGG
jgi:NADH-quinone oxidoreductase subunit M